MRKVGDFEWRQLSLWAFAPKGSVQTFVKSSDGEHTFHFYLERVTEITGDNSWRTEPVTSLEGLPDETVKWRGGAAFKR